MMGVPRVLSDAEEAAGSMGTVPSAAETSMGRSCLQPDVCSVPTTVYQLERNLQKCSLCLYAVRPPQTGPSILNRNPGRLPEDMLASASGSLSEGMRTGCSFPPATRTEGHPKATCSARVWQDCVWTFLDFSTHQVCGPPIFSTSVLGPQ